MIDRQQRFPATLTAEVPDVGVITTMRAKKHNKEKRGMAGGLVRVADGLVRLADELVRVAGGLVRVVGERTNQTETRSVHWGRHRPIASRIHHRV
jgi:hypothetical protein